MSYFYIPILEGNPGDIEGPFATYDEFEEGLKKFLYYYDESDTVVMLKMEDGGLEQIFMSGAYFEELQEQAMKDHLNMHGVPGC